MAKDWTGNSVSMFKTIGADGHGNEAREVDDFYATDPVVIKPLLEREKFVGSIWECACGQGHLSKELEKQGFNVISTDLYDRGYGYAGVDFLWQGSLRAENIITNPPYKYATEFVKHAIDLQADKIAMFMKLTFLETKGRKELFLKHPPKNVYVFSERVRCAIGGDFERQKNSNAIAYCWYVWEKDYTGKTVIGWV